MAITQILVYVGAIMVLFLFGMMLTRSKIGRQGDLNNKHWYARRVRRACCCSARSSTSLHRRVRQGQSCPTNAVPATTGAAERLIFGTYLMPFWALSFVLLAALIGAIVLARRD